MKTILIRLGLLVLIISGLAGCGGGGDGAVGASGTNGTNGTNGNEVKAIELTADQWLSLKPNIDPASISVTINNGVPVVKFAVTDQYGNPLAGLGGQSLASGALTPKNYNMFFTLAKLVPVTGGPSKWVNYLVTKPAATGTINASVADGMTWVGTYPTPDQEGTLVDNGDGTYQYTFLRNVAHAAAIVAGLADAGKKVKADLGDLTYDPSLTHRLGIVIQGSQPGTGTNTPNAVQVTTPVPMVNTFNIGYDFVPNGGAVTVMRDIVMKASCTECHQGRGIGHVTSNSTTTTNPTNGVPAGAFIGRNDPRLCVTCHTDQTKYGFVNVVEGTNADGSPALTTAYMRTTTGEAAFTFPRMIHQTHMGARNGVVPGSGLVKTGYNLNGHCNSPGQVGYDATKPVANQAQCYNQLEYPQDVRNCTKCHDGSVNAVNKTANGDNWMNVPSRMACGSCHDGIDFATGQGITLLDRDYDLASKDPVTGLAKTVNPVGTTHSGHQGGAQPDSACASCHAAGSVAIQHGPFDATAFTSPLLGYKGMPASAAPSLRTMSANITGASINATDGSVTVNFTLTDSAGGPVDDATVVAGTNTAPYVIPVTAGTSPSTLPFKSLNFTLAKLMPASNGASTYWKSYTGRCINNANIVPATTVLQGYSEIQYGQAATASKPAMAPGILTDLGGGKWSYKFALVNAAFHNADGSGQINTINTAIRTDVTGGLTCTDPDAGYDATLTHRIGMIFIKNDSLGADNATNATYDFVPDGVTKAATRNIVTMANCATCHAGRKIHKGYATELCVTCHNQNTSDPSATSASTTVDLQFIVHKLHYKGTDFSVHAETFGTGSMTGYPGNVMKCQVCHNENATKPTASSSDGVSSTKTGKLENAANWYTTPTSRACGTCHDDTAATAHIQQQIYFGVETCVVCHGAGSVDGLDSKSAHGKRLP